MIAREVRIRDQARFITTDCFLRLSAPHGRLTHFPALAGTALFLRSQGREGLTSQADQPKPKPTRPDGHRRPSRSRENGRNRTTSRYRPAGGWGLNETSGLKGYSGATRRP